MQTFTYFYEGNLWSEIKSGRKLFVGTIGKKISASSAKKWGHKNETLWLDFPVRPAFQKQESSFYNQPVEEI